MLRSISMERENTVTELYLCVLTVLMLYREQEQKQGRKQVFCSKQIAAVLEIYFTEKKQNGFKRIITQKSKSPFFKLIKLV